MRLRLAAILFTLLPLVALADAPTVAKIQSLKGGATVVDLGKEIVAAEGLELHDGFSVRGGPETRMTILFNDGNVRFVGRNAVMTWKAEGAAASVAGNAAAVVGHILSDGSANVFRNVVTGAAMGVRSIKEESALPAPSAPPAASPAQAPDTEKAVGRLRLQDQTEKVSEAVDGSMERTTGLGFGTHPAGEGGGGSASGVVDGSQPEIVQGPMVKKRNLAVPPGSASGRARAAAFRGEAADAWAAGRGFSPSREGALRVGRDGLLAPKLAGAKRYAVRLYAFGGDAPLFAAPVAGDPPELPPAALAPHVSRGAAYEYEFVAFDKKGSPFASRRLPFATLGEPEEAALDAALAGIDGLGAGTGVEARLLLKAMLFAKYGLDGLARHHAADAARGADPGVKDAAEDFLRALDGK